MLWCGPYLEGVRDEGTQEGSGSRRKAGKERRKRREVKEKGGEEERLAARQGKPSPGVMKSTGL